MRQIKTRSSVFSLTLTRLSTMSNVVFPPYPSSPSVYDYASTSPGYRTPTRPKRLASPVVSNPHLDQFSPEYTTAIHQSVSGHFSHTMSAPYEGNPITKDVQRALRAQERAHLRKVTLGSSPRNKKVLVARAPSGKPQAFPPSWHNTNVSLTSPNTVSDSQENRIPTKVERLRMRSFRFPRVKDSISLPYLQNRRKNTPSHPSDIDDTPPPVPPLPFRTMHPSSIATRSSPKHIAPLPRFDPFARPRADSLSSLVEARSAADIDLPPTRCGPATVRASRLRRVPTVNDLFSNINRQAVSLGMKTCV
ncbi:hypothetical protein GGU10DRAFT_434071 [Lentinula aff. detonsa]|uniref:Uncharacterized protein n=1 Tax=Lentinula aff. detonsa TaxID=2804958 RepID=A0AA38KGM6_9AGAR|nr:hypothetical protein GGU10DRAFT_434071 [Lentinula aff. detonsa]